MHRWWRRSRCNDDGRTFTPDEEIEGRDTVIMLGHVRTLCGSAAAKATRNLAPARAHGPGVAIHRDGLTSPAAGPEKTRTSCPICP